MASLLAVAAFLADALAFPPAFFAAAPVFEAAFFAAELAFLAVLFAAVFVADAAFAAAWTFFATATVKPAFCKSFALAFAIFATVFNFASFSFFAVAAPTPGSEVMSEVLPFPAMVSPVVGCPCPNLNLPPKSNEPENRFLHERQRIASFMEHEMPPDNDGFSPLRLDAWSQIERRQHPIRQRQPCWTGSKRRGNQKS